MRFLLRFLLLLILFYPAHAAPAHLEADASRSELVAGDTFAIDAYVFNDGSVPTSASFDIQGPAGFELVEATEVEASVAPGQALHARFVYRVLPLAPKGLARFVVSTGGLSADVWVRVGPIEWPAPLRTLYLPLARR
jgi:hypothetical protein